jgi:hypothetical protein
VAGISLEDGRWIRLRGKASDGALDLSEYVLADGDEVRVLDLIEADLHFALPSDCHPEDWQIVSAPWRLLQRPVKAEQWRKVTATADKATTILRGYRDRIAAAEARNKPMQASLVLVCPTEIHWWIREERGRRKYRALFRRHNVTYDFAVTDPCWIEQLSRLPAGIHSHSTFASEATETWLTISLSEEFHGWHYKLVAAVIQAPL